MTTSSSSASKAARKQTCTARCPTANVVDWRDFRCLRILWKLRHLFHFVSPSCILLQLLVSETIWMELVQQKHACTIPWTILLNFCYQRCIMIHRIPDECWVVQKYLRRCHHRNLPKTNRLEIGLVSRDCEAEWHQRHLLQGFTKLAVVPLSILRLGHIARYHLTQSINLKTWYQGFLKPSRVQQWGQQHGQGHLVPVENRSIWACPQIFR